MEKKTIQFIVYLPLNKRKRMRDKIPSNREDDGGGFPDNRKGLMKMSPFLLLASQKKDS
jgi:hypothetical protein